MSNILPIEMDQGSSLSHTFTLKDEAGAAFDLTAVGWDVRLQVRKTYGATSALINCTLANSKVAITNAAGGVITLNLLPADTTSIKFNSLDDDTLECVYDLELQSPIGKVYKPARGTFTLNREVTR